VPTAKGKRLGRPPKPEEPKGPEPYERREYRDRLQVIVDALEIDKLSKDVRLYLQMLLRRYDLLRATDAKRFPAKGEEQVTLLLRAVFESSNGAAALTLPILQAVSRCLNPVWVSKGLGLLDALDKVDLVGLHATLTDLGLSDQLDRALFKKLADILGPPALPAPPKQKPPAKRKTDRPSWASERSWGVVLALRKHKPKRSASAV
jgi:hypothetical protein